MKMGGLIFIVIGLGLIFGASRFAEYNRVLRSQEVVEAEKRLDQARSFKFLAQMRLDFYKSSVKVGKLDRISCVLTGLTTVSLGIFFLFHPDGW